MVCKALQQKYLGISWTTVVILSFSLSPSALSRCTLFLLTVLLNQKSHGVRSDEQGDQCKSPFRPVHCLWSSSSNKADTGRAKYRGARHVGNDPMLRMVTNMKYIFITKLYLSTMFGQYVIFLLNFCTASCAYIFDHLSVAEWFGYDTGAFPSPPSGFSTQFSLHPCF